MDTNNLCLGILSLGDASGYEIKKKLEETFSHFQATSFGSIYPALAKLTEAGLVNFTEITQEKRPAKKVFHITTAGQESFLGSLMTLQPAEQYKSDFLVLMMFAHLLPEERLTEVFQQQLKYIQEELELLTNCRDESTELTAGMRFTLEYGIAANQGLLKLMEQRQRTVISEIIATQQPSKL